MSETVNEFAGQVAIVTGAASGIGRSTALMLAASGATVVVLDKSGDGVLDVVAEIEAGDGRGVGREFDLAQSERIAALVDGIVEELGRVDILINCAGFRGHHQSLKKLELDVWELTQKINVTAPLLLIQAVSAAMIERGEGGRIVNISSGAAHIAGYAPAYACSKAALNQLTRSAAGQLGRHGILVNSVAPGLVDTPGVETLTDLEGAVKRGGPMANLIEKVTQPEDVAEVIAFLCRPASGHITGQTIHVNAGALVF